MPLKVERHLVITLTLGSIMECEVRIMYIASVISQLPVEETKQKILSRLDKEYPQGYKIIKWMEKPIENGLMLQAEFIPNEV